MNFCYFFGRVMITILLIDYALNLIAPGMNRFVHAILFMFIYAASFKGVDDASF